MEKEREERAQWEWEWQWGVIMFGSMQKELKALDRELKNNGLWRVTEGTGKQESSLLRALSTAVYYSAEYWEEVRTEVRLTVISNLGEKRSNAYPAIHEPAMLKKYQAMPELLLEFWACPELPCFHNDLLLVASAAYARSITLYTLDKDHYLNELYISACKTPREQRLCLARVGKKYYAVLPAHAHDLLPFLRNHFLDSLLGAIFDPREDRIHYPHYDEVVTGRRQHKKSLSDCGDIPLVIQAFEERKKELQESSDRGPAFQQPPKPAFDRYEDEFFDGYTRSYTLEGLERGYSLEERGYGREGLERVGEEGRYGAQFEAGVGYYGYPFQYYAQGQFPGYLQAGPVNNERYTGRLKFFDQAGNYGFIVIDKLNIDLFVHYDDLSKAGLSKEKLLALKNNYELRFQFTYYEYEGKQHKKSKKAVDLLLLTD